MIEGPRVRPENVLPSRGPHNTLLLEVFTTAIIIIIIIIAIIMMDAARFNLTYGCAFIGLLAGAMSALSILELFLFLLTFLFFVLFFIVLILAIYPLGIADYTA